jgi:tRNA threonylcarbamoyladenosine biosynthesis protein TsaB
LNILAIDTSDARGSVCVLRESRTTALRAHQTNADYSEWLLPAVNKVLRTSSLGMEDLDLLAVSTGPGSFTGLRVGLTTVKAWAEVYGLPVAGVSRLEGIASRSRGDAGLIAAFYDAQRGQVFGGVYSKRDGKLEKVEDEMVIAPEGFFDWVGARAGEKRVNWVSLDPDLITGLAGWDRRLALGDGIERCAPELAVEIGSVAETRAREGIFTDPLALDANYVRRSDAEIFWKGR